MPCGHPFGRVANRIDSCAERQPSSADKDGAWSQSSARSMLVRQVRSDGSGVEIYKDRAEYRWRQQARNNEIVADSNEREPQIEEFWSPRLVLVKRIARSASVNDLTD
jgi:hypothetical protein